MNKEELQQIVSESVSKSDVCRALGIQKNGHGLRQVGKLIEEHSIDITHFSHSAAVNKYNRKYLLIEKCCSVCGSLFTTLSGHPREKTVCSRACSNTFFRSGENNPNWKSGGHSTNFPIYRRICFDIWDQKCAVCGFDEIVSVHHIDENHSNNDVSNLIPLCPNHHAMCHTSKNKASMKEKIRELQKNNTNLVI